MLDRATSIDPERVIEYVAFLRESQFWSPDRLARYQEGLLERLVVHAYEHVPFYAERLKPLFRRRFGPHLHKWDQVPILSRREVLEHAEALRSRRVPADHGRIRGDTSSGSTGVPVRFWSTRLSGYAGGATTTREHEWHGRDRNRPLVSLRAFLPDGKDHVRSHGWGPMARLLGFTGPGHALDAALPVGELTARIKDLRPAYLNAYPSLLAGIAAHILDHPGLRFDLAGVMAMAEVLSEETRAVCRRAWGLEVADRYGARETGPIADECPEGRLYHLNDEIIRTELLDAGGAPVGPGEIGRAVLTPFYNYAMPLIRYEIGDFAVAGSACPCGRGLPTIERIAGRARSRFVRPDGETYWPTVGSKRMVEICPFRQYQFVQTAPDAVTIKLVSDHDPTERQRERLAALTRQYLHAPLTVTVECVEEIPRNPGGKFEDYVCEVDPRGAEAAS